MMPENPRKVVLTDCIGAWFTAFFLFVILKRHQSYFGMPENILTGLAITAAILSVYSLSGFFLIKNRWSLFLYILAAANFLYCTVSAGFVIYYFPSLTFLGVTYFTLEITIMFFLIFVELKAAKLSKNVRSQ